MHNKFKITASVTAILLISSAVPAKSQLLQDTAVLSLVKKDIDLIYNMHFDEARILYDRITAEYPGHPVIYLMRGLMTYWENYPMLSTSPVRSSFESDMHECIKTAEKHLYHDHEAEYLLSDLCGRGFMLLFYTDNNLVTDVIPLATSTYKYLIHSFDFTSQCADLFYFTGLYNYYREAYPKAYPIYKPLAMLFPSGDDQTGLKQLNYAAVNSSVLKAESYFILTYIYIYFENDYSEAYKYSSILHSDYPDNPKFLAAFLKNLLLMKKYNEAEKVIDSLPSAPSNRFFSAQLYIFRGILQEKKYNNFESAEKYYQKGISDISPFGEYGDQYKAYGYFGLSRINNAKGDRNTGQIYRREAIKVASFKKVDFD